MIRVRGAPEAPLAPRAPRLAAPLSAQPLDPLPADPESSGAQLRMDTRAAFVPRLRSCAATISTGSCSSAFVRAPRGRSIHTW